MVKNDQKIRIKEILVTELGMDIWKSKEVEDPCIYSMQSTKRILSIKATRADRTE